jgi:hypothetical protein
MAVTFSQVLRLSETLYRFKGGTARRPPHL